MKQSKNLQVIQRVSKIGMVLSKISFIVCLVGMIICLIAVATIHAGTENILKFGGVSVQSIFGNQGLSEETMYAYSLVGAIICIGEGILAKMSCLYFKHELEAGTPFTTIGAKELMKLGIMSFVIPIVTSVVANVVYNIINNSLTSVADMHIDPYLTSSGFGLVCILIALLCRYGAELEEMY